MEKKVLLTFVLSLGLFACDPDEHKTLEGKFVAKEDVVVLNNETEEVVPSGEYEANLTITRRAWVLNLSDGESVSKAIKLKVPKETEFPTEDGTITLTPEQTGQKYETHIKIGKESFTSPVKVEVEGCFYEEQVEVCTDVDDSDDDDGGSWDDDYDWIGSGDDDDDYDWGDSDDDDNDWGSSDDDDDDYGSEPTRPNPPRYEPPSPPRRPNPPRYEPGDRPRRRNPPRYSRDKSGEEQICRQETVQRRGKREVHIIERGEQKVLRLSFLDPQAWSAVAVFEKVEPLTINRERVHEGICQK